MSELTKEKIYKKELEKVGGEGNNNLERIRSLAGSGTTVIANPQLSGDEADLTGLQVGDTKYAVPQGGGTQGHTLKIQNGSTATLDLFLCRYVDGALVVTHEIINGNENAQFDNVFAFNYGLGVRITALNAGVFFKAEESYIATPQEEYDQIDNPFIILADLDLVVVQETQ